MSVGPLKDKEGKQVNKPEEMADLLAEHYSSVFRTEVLPMEEMDQVYNGDSPLLDTQFSESKRDSCHWPRPDLCKTFEKDLYLHSQGSV